jgi:hypothetical protein
LVWRRKLDAQCAPRVSGRPRTRARAAASTTGCGCGRYENVKRVRAMVAKLAPVIAYYKERDGVAGDPYAKILTKLL